MELREQINEDLSSLVNFNEYSQVVGETLDTLRGLILSVYDNPNASVTEKTSFFDKDGEELDYRILLFKELDGLVAVVIKEDVRFFLKTKFIKFAVVIDDDELKKISSHFTTYFNLKKELESFI